jgi:hypothetical protein
MLAAWVPEYLREDAGAWGVRRSSFAGILSAAKRGFLVRCTNDFSCTDYGNLLSVAR